jgi:hypothetical protein
MLYVLHRANYSELAYRGGQEPIVHLQADLQTVVAWAESDGVRWAFSLSNAGARYAEFRSAVADLAELDWPAIASPDFSRREVKERKQAEFLLPERLPLDLVERIGVVSPAVRVQVTRAISGASRKPVIEVRREWYF